MTQLPPTTETTGYTGPLEPLGDCCFRIPKSYKPGMLVDGLVFASEPLLTHLRTDRACEQVANVAFLPGIQTASLAMPDIHWGYGFCIGGGGVGYDINCGVRLVRTNLTVDAIRPEVPRLIAQMLRDIPVGVGQGGRFVFEPAELKELLTRGVPFLAERGLATADDILCTESEGCIAGADPAAVSERAILRGRDQCGTVGAGNHFVEVQHVERIEHETAAAAFGLAAGQVVVLIHSGSRGLGYQVCDDAIRSMRDLPAAHGIVLPDRQLVCAPVESPEGGHYLAAMRAAANFAFCNRQLLMVQAREVFQRVFGRPWQLLGMELVYDVAHNMAKLEEHVVDGRPLRVCVHRKGATRAFPAGHPDVPDRDHPRRHGPGQLGAGGRAQVDGAVVRHHLPRRGPGPEPHRGGQARRWPQHRRGARAGGCRGPCQEPQGARRGAAGRLQGRRSGGRCGRSGRALHEGRQAATARRDQGLTVGERSGGLTAGERPTRARPAGFPYSRSNSTTSSSLTCSNRR